MTIVTGNLTPEQHEQQRELFATRKARIVGLIAADSAVLENGFEIPNEPARYLAIEYSSGDPVWAMNEETLQDIASAIEASDTSRDDVAVIDLDTKKHLGAEFRIVAFWQDGERIDLHPATNPQLPAASPSRFAGKENRSGH